MKYSLRNAVGKKARAAAAFAAAAPAAVFTNVVMALDEDSNTAIGTAYTSAETSVGLTTSGLIGLVTLIVGVGMVIALLRKG